MDEPELVSTSRWGIPGVNYHYANRNRWNISLEELAAVGITNDEAYVHSGLIVPLLNCLALLLPHGYELLVEDAYRSPATYALIRRKFVEQEGEAAASRLFNMEHMPHVSGRCIDVSLVDVATGQKVWLRNDARDGLDAKFAGFYVGKPDAESREFQRRQDVLHSAMFESGFSLGSKREVWHFELPL